MKDFDLRKYLAEGKLLKEEDAEMDEKSKKYFGVFQKGGSIGQGKDKPLYSFVDKEEAKQKAKRLRQTLTPGEKSYYGMGYIVKPTNVAPKSLDEASAEYVNKDAYNYKVGDIIGNTVQGFDFKVIRIEGDSVTVRDEKSGKEFKTDKDNMYKRT